MAPSRSLATRSRAQRGAALLESLIAFVILATGTLAVASLQGQMRLHAELARQRSEAVRLGQQELEQLRAFSVIAPASAAHAYASIADADRIADRAGGYDSNTAYRIARRIDDAAIPGAKSASVTVSWSDRSGTVQRVVLDSVIAGEDPAYAASLALGAGNGAPRGAFARSALIPVATRSLGDGRSVWKPDPGGAVAYVFDDTTGRIVARCSGIAASVRASDLSSADLTACSTTSMALVSGVVRFSDTVPPAAADARDATLDLSASLALAGSGYPGPADCSTDPMKTVRHVADGSLHIDAVALDATPASMGLAAWTDTGDRFVAYRCVVTPRPNGRWSGRVTLTPSGWTIGAGAADRRVCRFVDDHGGSAIDADIGHPPEDVDAGSSLIAQNFLVVRGDALCPAVSATSLLATAVGTVQHQP